MQIFVKDLTSKSLAFDVAPEQSINSLKQKIQEQEGIASELISLIYEGKNLENENTIDSTDLGNLSTVHMVLALKGGKKKKKRK